MSHPGFLFIGTILGPFSQEISRDKAVSTTANKLSHQWAVPQVQPIALKFAERDKHYNILPFE